MNDENTSENSTLLNDRQLLEQIFNKLVTVEDHLISLENRVDSLEQNINSNVEIFNERLLKLEVQTDTLTSLAYQALSVAHAVKGDVRALREELSSHGRDISELQKRLLTMA